MAVIAVGTVVVIAVGMAAIAVATAVVIGKEAPCACEHWHLHRPPINAISCAPPLMPSRYGDRDTYGGAGDRYGDRGAYGGGGLQMCRDFQFGRCTRGASCRFSHGADSYTAPPPGRFDAPNKSAGACFDFIVRRAC